MKPLGRHSVVSEDANTSGVTPPGGGILLRVHKPEVVPRFLGVFGYDSFVVDAVGLLEENDSRFDNFLVGRFYDIVDAFRAPHVNRDHPDLLPPSVRGPDVSPFGSGGSVSVPITNPSFPRKGAGSANSAVALPEFFGLLPSLPLAAGRAGLPPVAAIGHDPLVVRSLVRARADSFRNGRQTARQDGERISWGWVWL